MNNQSLIGGMFRLTVPLMGNPVDTMGYVFSEYPDFDDNAKLGVQVIFPNGEYDGFSVEEQGMFLHFMGYDERYTNYKFRNVMQVTRDFNNGYWRWQSLENKY